MFRQIDLLAQVPKVLPSLSEAILQSLAAVPEQLIQSYAVSIPVPLFRLFQLFQFCLSFDIVMAPIGARTGFKRMFVMRAAFCLTDAWSARYTPTATSTNKMFHSILITNNNRIVFL